MRDTLSITHLIAYLLLLFYEQDQPSYINTKIKYKENNKTKYYNNNNKTKIKKSRVKPDAGAGPIIS